MRTVLLVTLLIFCTATLNAQSTTGTLLGTVKDPSGSVVPGAKVQVVNEATGIAVEASTNESGDYVALNLPAASYRVKVESAGMQSVTVSGVRLLLNTTVRTDVVLKPGMVEQSITVTGEAPVVSSETSSISNVVDEHAVASLPLNGRTLDYIILMTAGNAADSASNPKIGGSLHWGGNYYSVDGASFNDTGNGSAAYSYQTALTTTPSVDTVQEVKVESNAGKAENEGSAAISMITKSGGNAFHGSVFEFNRNRALAAKSFFATNQAKPGFNRNEFGGTVSGPIIRKKTFFSASYEGLRQRTPRTPNVALVVPTAAQRQGEFGATTVRDPLSGVPFAGNRIPTDRIDPRAARLLTYIPLPNQSVASGANYIVEVGNVLNTNRGSLKLDHRLTPQDALTASLSYSKGDPYFVARGTPPNYGNYGDAGYTTKSGVLTHTHTFARGALNELRLSYFSHVSIRLGQNLDFDPTTLFPTLYKPLPVGGLPLVNITGYTGISDSGGGMASPQITVQLVDQFSYVRGPHTIKVGGEISSIRLSTNPAANSPAFGGFTFNARYSGNALADLLLGYPSQTSRATASQVNLLHQMRYAGFVQDDWKVTPRLTLNVGLRYMVQTAMQERDGSWTNFDLATGQYVIRTANGEAPRLSIPRMLQAYPWVGSETLGWGSNVMLTDRNNFAPRFGFAWRPFAGNKTVVRGSYGIFYNQVPSYIGVRQISLNNSPFALTETFEAAAGTTPSLTLANPFPGSGAISANPTVNAVNRKLSNALSQQWNFTIERQIMSKLGLRLTYLGNKSTRVPWYGYNRNLPTVQAAGTLQARRPYQPWASITYLDPNGNSFTNQMQVEVTRRVASGLYVFANFTWNKTLDNVPVSGSPQNPYDAAADRGNGDSIRQHIFNFAGTYRLPFGQGKRYLKWSGPAGHLVGGWTLSTLTILRSGAPFSVVFSSNNTAWYATRADVVGDSHVENPGLEGWFNTAAFRIPETYKFGNSGRNLLFGPGQIKLDISLQKESKIAEKYTVQFRAEAFNMPNHPSFSSPGNSLSTPSTFGKIRGTSVEARVVQFGLKLLF
jgi:hypothetical protein